MSREQPTQNELEIYASLGITIAMTMQKGKMPEAMMLAGALLRLAGDITNDPPPDWIQEATLRGLNLFRTAQSLERDPK